MSAQEESQELQREWRQMVLEKLNNLENGQRDFYNRLDYRVRCLEDVKSKAIAVWVVLQGLTFLLAWVYVNVLK